MLFRTEEEHELYLEIARKIHKIGGLAGVSVADLLPALGQAYKGEVAVRKEGHQ
jgi:hypothetical protein